MTYQKDVVVYQEVERKAHVFNRSSIVNKVTQETLEMKQGMRRNDLQNVIEEARDAIVNILSATYHAGVMIDESLLDRNLEVTGDDVDDALAEWNEDIQGINQEYSRREVSPEQLKASTEKLISTILSYSGLELTLAQILQFNTEKFRARIPKYRPNINLKDYITNHPDFPKPGIQFKNIFPVFEIPEVKRFLKNEIRRKLYGVKKIALCSSRGYLFDFDDIAMIPVAKKGKLPGDVVSQTYEKEYGIDELEIFNNIQPGEEIALIDDLLATSGTLDAAGKAIEKAGGKVSKVIIVVKLNDEYCVSQRLKYNIDRYPIEYVVEYDE